MLEVAVVSVLICSKGRIRSLNLHFFFLGVAFLLIETLSVTRFAMLFGSTWVVNTIVFSSILVVAVVANVWMQRLTVTISSHGLYALLAAAVLLNYVFPIHALLQVRLAGRLGAAMALMGAPIFVAAFIFARSFKETPDPALAFASNLVGAVVGGLLEYSSLVIGFRNLLLIGLGLYALSYIAILGRGPGRASAA